VLLAEFKITDFMAYRFQNQGSVETNVRRILGEQLDKARYQLTEHFSDYPADAIHDARKRLKKARSVLRLMRKALDKDVYKHEKNTLRDAGRLLAPARDGEAYRGTLNNLIDYYSSVLEEDAFDTLREWLLELNHRRLRQLIDHDEPMNEVITTLKDSQQRLKQLSLDKSDWDALGKGLKKIYRQGRDRMETAYEEMSDAAFHQWRKRVKDLWYDSRLLKPIWPGMMNSMKSEAHLLSKYLGDDHDIAELRSFLLDQEEQGALQDAHLDLLLPLMKHRQGRLRQKARSLGQLLYAETPESFTERIETYWHIWCNDSEE
jgi:hypothetical protein